MTNKDESGKRPVKRKGPAPETKDARIREDGGGISTERPKWTAGGGDKKSWGQAVFNAVVTLIVGGLVVWGVAEANRASQEKIAQKGIDAQQTITALERETQSTLVAQNAEAQSTLVALSAEAQSTLAAQVQQLERPQLEYRVLLSANPGDPECPEVVTETIEVTNVGATTAISVSVQVPTLVPFEDTAFAISPHAAAPIEPGPHSLSDTAQFEFPSLRNSERIVVHLPMKRDSLQGWGSVYHFLYEQEKSCVITCDGCPASVRGEPASVPPYWPPSSADDEEVACWRYYTVVEGQSLAEIAHIYGVPLLDIAEANHLANPDLIYTGQVLRIPCR